MPAPAAPNVPGSPRVEHLRSPAALAVARLAHESELFFAHYEHRLRLPLPAAWLMSDRSGLASSHPAGSSVSAGAADGQWVGGVLAEPKYQGFRHDLLVASFHPGHRAKWTAHELCHALVGFTFRPGATRLHHALGAWLAELLPVALWYFFDEAGLRHCERHSVSGPLFREHCEACERAARVGMRRLTKDDAAKVREGRAFVDRELAALSRSRRLGRPEGTRFATIDLASDGLAYAHAHAARLAAPEMERFVAQFFGPEQGCHDRLDALEARVEEICNAITRNRRARPWRASRWDYAAQDVGYRLLTLRAEAEGQVAQELDRLIDGLAARRTQHTLAKVARSFAELALSTRRRKGRARLPGAEEVFAVGYDLPGELGRSRAQIGAGVASACPGTHRALGRGAAAVVARFVAQDAPERSPLGRRFARFLGGERVDAVADLARVEAALTHVAPRDPIAAALPHSERSGEHFAVAAGTELLRITHDVLGAAPEKLVRLRRLPEPRFLGIVRSGSDDVDILELPAEAASVLMDAGSAPLERGQIPLEDEGLEALLDTGLLVPERYRLL